MWLGFLGLVIALLAFDLGCCIAMGTKSKCVKAFRSPVSKSRLTSPLVASSGGSWVFSRASIPDRLRGGEKPRRIHCLDRIATEHDNPHDWQRFASRSINHLRQWGL